MTYHRQPVGFTRSGRLRNSESNKTPSEKTPAHALLFFGFRAYCVFRTVGGHLHAPRNASPSTAEPLRISASVTLTK